MLDLRRLALAAALAALLPGAAHADGRRPGSLLVYPLHDSRPGTFTLLSVTNTNPLPAGPGTTGGTTNVLFEYVNAESGAYPGAPTECQVFDRVETLTPADTLTVLTFCHDVPGSLQGYAVVTAQDPLRFKQPWSWNHLVGSELVVSAQGGVYALNAIPFRSPLEEGQPTDLDLNGQRDFDGLEYEGTPDELYLDFIAGMEPALVLINLTGGTGFDAVVSFDLWNDNEFALSTTYSFRCWTQERLEDVSPLFSEDFLRHNTPDDPGEIDADCDQDGEHEAGWTVVRGLVAHSSAQTFADPALLGASTYSGASLAVAEGRLPWESAARQTNGSFLNFGSFWPDPPAGQ